MPPCREELKELQFHCDMRRRTWVLPPERYSAHQEQRLRHLLRHGQLPPPGARLPALPRGEEAEDEGEEEAGDPIPQAASARAAAAAAAARRHPGLAPAAPPPPGAAPAPAAGPPPQGTPAQRERRRVRAREEEPAEREFVDGRVAMRREAGGRFLLEGVPLLHIRWEGRGAQ